MHFSWLMHLFIVLLFSRFSLGKQWPLHDASNEEDTTKSIFDYEDDTTKSIFDHDDDIEDIHSNEDEEEDSSTTPSLSPSDDIIRTTNAITKTTTSKSETIPRRRTTTTTYSTWSTTEYYSHVWGDFGTTLSLQEIEIYKAKANRERLLLKIFTITVAVGMSILAVVLFTIHLLRKSKRYHGYHAPANNPSNKQTV